MGYSWEGLKLALSESAFRQELLLAAALLPIAIWVDVSSAERALLIGGVLLVLIVELLNCAVEAAIDRVSLEDHELAKRAKDLGSAAVFLTFVNLAVVWAIIMWPMMPK